MIEIKLCEYGCGQEAQHQMSNGKWCCENFYTKCPKLREKNIIGSTGKKRTNDFKRKISLVHKGKVVSESQKLKQRKKMINLRKDPTSKYNTKEYIERNKVCNIGKKWTKNQTEKMIKAISGKKFPKLYYYLNRYPDLFKFEIICEDIETKNLLVNCKVCGKQFSPSNTSYNKISYRAEMINQGKINKGVFLCSEKCKEDFLNQYKSEYEIYCRKVWKETYKSLNRYSKKIPNIELRSKKFHLDHKYSIHQGFQNNVNPIIIGHWKNLEIVEYMKNLKKYNRCSITLENLIQETNSSI